VAVVLAAIVHLLFVQGSATQQASVGVHSLLAFLSLVTAAAIAFQNRESRPIWRVTFLSMFVYVAAANFVSAIRYMSIFVDLGPSTPILESSTGILETTIVTVLLLVSVAPSQKLKSSISLRRGLALLLPILLVSIILETFYHCAAPRVLTPSGQLVLGIVLAVAGIASVSVSVLLVSRHREVRQRWDSVTFASGTLLVGVSMGLRLASLVAPAVVSQAFLSVSAFAYYCFFVSAGVPLLKGMGVASRVARLEVFTLAFLLVAPYFIGIVTETLAPGLVLVDLQMYVISHVGAVFLSGVTCILLYAYTSRRPAWNRYPLILAVAAWMVVELFPVLMAPAILCAEYASSLLYVGGSVIALLSFLVVVYWTVHPPARRFPTRLEGALLVSLMVAVVELWLGAGLQLLGGLTAYWFYVRILFQTVLLAVSLISVFTLTYVLLFLSRENRGELSIEIIAAGFLSLWLVANILRGSFGTWTGGWWAAELLMLFGLIGVPAVIGMVYLQQLTRTEALHRRALLYSDILVHDLRNYHQVLQSSLDVLSLLDLPAGAGTDALLEASTSLDRANQLIANIRSLDKAEQLAGQSLELTDLVQTILDAWEHVRASRPGQGAQFHINRVLGECHVRANPLLLDVFLNLFRNALEYSKNEKDISVDIQASRRGDRKWWEIHVIDHGQGIPDDQKSLVFKRHGKNAHGLGLGLSVVRALVEAFGGSISVGNRVAGDHTKGTVFLVILPAAKG
jgi:signal transduction histidine kinase